MRKLSFIYLLFCISISSIDAAFMTLRDAQEYAGTIEEYPPIDNDNRLDPNYTSFYAKSKKGRIKQVIEGAMQLIGVQEEPKWSPEDFKSLMQKLVTKREHNALTGNIIQKITPPAGANVVVWGDVQGAFHSLVRDLVKLEGLGIITNDFKVRGNNYLAFNGDVIDRSPHILETLTLVMRLMQVNPRKIFYIRGNHESKDHWHDYGLKRELQVRARHLSKEKIPLNSLIKRFFFTLPLALYLKSGHGEQASFVRISHYGREYGLLDESYFPAFLHKKDNGKPRLFKLVNRKKTRDKVDMKALIKGISRSTSYQPTDGLTLLSPERGATTWTLLSAPTSTYRILYEFFNDAFSIIKVKPSIDEWEINLYHQDVRDMQGFGVEKYNLLSGQRIIEGEAPVKKEVAPTGEKKPGVKKKVTPSKTLRMSDVPALAPVVPKTDKGLVLGASVDLSKTSAGLGKRLVEGLSLRINKENRAGGIRGERVNIIVLDDEYTPHLTDRNVDEFLKKHHTPLVLTPLGTPTTESLLKKVKKKEILVLFPYTGASIFRTPELPHIINYRTSYANEALALLEYALDTLQLSRFAFFYQDDSYGLAPLVASRNILKNRGITEWVEASYLRNEVKVEKAAEKIKEFNPEAILFFSTYAPSAELIRKIDVRHLTGKTLMGISFLTDRFRKFIEAKGQNFIISRVVPNPDTSELPLVKEYRDDMEEIHHGRRLTVDSLEAYINVSVLFNVVKGIKGEINPVSIIAGIESLKDYDLKGLKLNFDPKTRELSKDVWLDVGEGEWLHRTISPEEEKIALGEPDKKVEPAAKEPASKEVVPKKETPKEAPQEKVAPKKEVPKEAPPKEEAPEKGEEEKVVAPPKAPPVKEVSSFAVSNGEIVLGCTLWSSEQGGLSPSFMKGISMRINEENVAGGVNDKQLKVIFLDDKYIPGLARKNIETFLTKYKTNIILAPNGSPTLLGYLDKVKNKEVLVMFPETGAGAFRIPEDHLVHFRASYTNEARALTNYIVETKGLSKVAIFYQNDAYGKSGLIPAVKILKAKGVKNILELPYARRSTNFAKQVKKIEEFSPSAILFFSTDKTASSFLRQLKTHMVVGKLLLGFSDMAIESFRKFVKARGLKFVTAQIMPDPHTSELAIVKEFREVAQRTGVTPDPFILEGYINSDLTIDILKKVKGEITKEKVIEVINGIKNYEYKGLHLDLNPQTRELFHSLWLETETGEWLEQKIK